MFAFAPAATVAPVAARTGPIRAATAPDSNAPSSLEEKMKIELTDCRNDAGISQPKMTRWVRRSAKRFIEEPACSNPAQNRTAAMKNTKITAIRFFSAFDSFDRNRTAPK